MKPFNTASNIGSLQQLMFSLLSVPVVLVELRCQNGSSMVEQMQFLALACGTA